MVSLAVLKHHEINGICCEVKKALSKQELDRAGGSSRGGGESVRVEGRGLGGSERVMRTDVDIFGISDYRGRLLVRTVYRLGSLETGLVISMFQFAQFVLRLSPLLSRF